MSDPSQQPPRTCGGCKWFTSAGDGMVIGFCKAPAPMMLGTNFMTDDFADATRCPCFTPKEQ